METYFDWRHGSFDTYSRGKKQCLTDDNSVEWIEEFSLRMTYVGNPVGGSRE